METRAHYVLVGAFTLAALIGVFLFVIWLAKTSFDRSYATYDIYFQGSVAGLKVGGDVLYNGLKVGEVREIKLAPKDPSRVRVRIRVDTTAPISEDTVAILGFQGLTGVSAVNLSGGSPGSSALPVRPGDEYPVIRSKPSTFDELIQGLPNLIAKGSELLDQLNLLLSEENRDSIRGILHHLDVVTGSSDLPRMVKNGADAAAEFKQAAARLNRLTGDLETLTGDADKTVRTELQPLIHDARGMTQSLERLADDLEKQEEPALRNFTQNGLPEVTQAARDLQQLSQTLDRFLQHVESDPGRFLWGNPNAGYQPK